MFRKFSNEIICTLTDMTFVLYLVPIRFVKFFDGMDDDGSEFPPYVYSYASFYSMGLCYPVLSRIPH